MIRPASRRVGWFVLAGAAACAAVAASAAGSDLAPASAAQESAIIVRARSGKEAAAEAYVRRLGGSVVTRLAIIGGFSATVQTDKLEALRASRSIRSITLDGRLSPQGSSYAADYDPAVDGYSMSAITQLTGARAWWNAGYTGKGIDVALIDSGVAPVQGLSDGGKVVNGPDLSLESQAPNLEYLDTYGHGTFMAGLIAGRDGTPSSVASASTYLGIAPDARIVSIKVADADGGTDVSQVIAAIDWVVQHRSDPGLNIRVLNLSYGTNSIQSSAVDPLAYAAEQAWKHGIVVVAAGGNDGFQVKKSLPALADPASDPYVLAVGAVDTMATQSLTDDQVPDFSPWPKKGSTRGVDLVAPGVHMQGLRVPNSFIDANHPEGFLSARYFRGSGTSESTAIVSGAAALVLQKYPDATPDQVKKLLVDSAVRIAGKSQAIGGGELQLAHALTASVPVWMQTWASATGTGTLEGARGTDHLTLDGDQLTGEQDIFGSPVDTSALAVAEAAGNSWSGGLWNGNSWSGNSWSGNSWSGNSWSGNSWSTANWSGNSWSGSTWTGGSWAAAFWG